jgi:hypothetical protein
MMIVIYDHHIFIVHGTVPFVLQKHLEISSLGLN